MIGIPEKVMFRTSNIKSKTQTVEEYCTYTQRGRCTGKMGTVETEIYKERVHLYRVGVFCAGTSRGTRGVKVNIRREDSA